MQSEKKDNKLPSVYFIVPAPLTISPGQRFRFEHYLEELKERGIKYKVSSFYSLSEWSTLYTSGNKTRKAWSVLNGLGRRVKDLFLVSKYSYVYLYREAAPIGPPVFEWIIAKLLRKKIIYDFDDAIWIPVTSSYNKAASKLKNFEKVAKICRWAHKISVGNVFLDNYAKQFNKNVVLVPTVVNTKEVHNQLQKQQISSPAIGWTGTFSTLQYLNIILPVLQDLQTVYDFTFFVIADKDPQLPLKDYRFIKWSKETEAQDLLNFHIGLMPLYDNEIAKGKCGFKAIQYMSLGIPAVVSPVGVNSQIVDEGVNGFVCQESIDWKQRLELLLKDADLRTVMGRAARKKIEDHYSVTATKDLFISLFA